MLSVNQRAVIPRAVKRGEFGPESSRYSWYVGSKIDKEFKARVDVHPESAGKVKTTPNGKRGPDVIGVGENDGQWWDLTTQRDWDRGCHQRKYDPEYGSDYEGIIWWCLWKYLNQTFQ